MNWWKLGNELLNFFRNASIGTTNSQLYNPDEGVLLNTFHGIQTFRGTLVAFLGDTPAANYVSGFKEGVGGAMRMCRTCYCSKTDHQNEMLTLLTHNDCEIRKLEQHVRHTMDVSDVSLTAVTRTYWSKFWGINRLSSLNDVRFFDVCQCMPHDIMHILLEGVVPFEMKLLLLHAIDNLNLFTINWLNGKIQLMALYGLEAKDRPSPIDRNHLNTRGHKLNQSAAQFMTCNILPYIIGKLLPENDQHWYCMRLLLQITNLSLANELTVQDATIMATLIEEHHHLYLFLYGEDAVTPKWHFMVHLPNQILQFGPLRTQWCMRFEAKHHFFKQAMVKNSYKNVPMSMAYHHQYYLCHQLLLNHGQIASNYLYSGDTHLLDARSFEVPVGLEEAMDELTFGGDVSFSLAIHVDRHGIRFAVGNVVCTTYKEDDFPLFAFIMHILIFDENVVFIVQKAITDNFDNDYLSYKIRKVDDVCIYIFG